MAMHTEGIFILPMSLVSVQIAKPTVSHSLTYIAGAPFILWSGS